jgi:hypothetical protein
MIITALAGLILLYRKAGLYERNGEFREAVQNLHNYELLAPYVGTVAAALMVAVAITGVAVFCQIHLRKRKALSSAARE